MECRIVKVSFDPMDGKTRELFCDPVAKTLYLLWRPNHLVNQYFIDECMDFANRFRENRPQNNDQWLRLINNAFCGLTNFAGAWLSPDTRATLAEYWPYFKDDCNFIDYEITK